MRPKQVNVNNSTSMVLHKETWWDQLQSRASEKWNNWGDSMGLMSHVVDKVDGYRELWKSVSTTSLAQQVSKIQKDDPYFTLEGLEEWVRQDLFPKFLKAEKMDKFLKKHTGEAVRVIIHSLLHI